jgi:kynurenine formamidase
MWHGFSTTHIDALCHEFHDGKFYNGFPVAENLLITGSKKVSVMTMKDGVFTRGVLLDIARQEGRYLQVGERVHVDDLERAEAAAGVKVGKGDVLVVRVGAYPRMAVEGIEPAFSPDFVRAGLDADCMPWLHEREVALFGGDCIERMPSGYPSLRMPLHQIAVIEMGMPLLDHLAVEELAAACEDLNRWEFALTFAPWRVRGGTGSAVNPTAIF